MHIIRSEGSSIAMGFQPFEQDLTVPGSVSCPALDSIANHTQSAIIAPVIPAFKESSDILLRFEVVELLETQFQVSVEYNYIGTKSILYSIKVVFSVIPQTLTGFGIYSLYSRLVFN